MEASPLIITCGDGGLQGSFIAGAMAHIVRKWPAASAPTTQIFATSASVATLFYHFSQTLDDQGKRIWTADVPGSSFLAYKSVKCLFSGNPIYDIDHLIEIVFKQNNPLDTDAIRAMPQHFAFPIVNLRTRKTEIFSNKPELAQSLFPRRTVRNWLEYDIYDLIKAACAIPILYDRPVKLGDDLYCDAGVADPFLVPEVVPAGTRAIYLTSGVKPVWSNDLKVQLAAFVWWCRSFMGLTGLPHWVYAHIMFKPFKTMHLARSLRRLITSHTLVTPHKPLSSSLQNTPESALYNWDAGDEHITLRQPEFDIHFERL